MRTIVFRLMLALAAFTVVPNVLAADTDSGNFFLNAKFGRMSNNSAWGDTGPSTQTHSSGGVSGGYLWKLDSGSSLGLELGYMDFGHISDGNDANEFTTETASANAMTVGINYQYPFGADEAWYAQARAGLMRAKLDATFTFDMGGHRLRALVHRMRVACTSVLASGVRSRSVSASPWLTPYTARRDRRYN